MNTDPWHGEREMIPLELDQNENDPVINQHIMQMIDTVKIFRNVAATSPIPAGLRNHYFCIPSTTNNLRNNQDPKFSAPLKDYTNIKTTLDHKLRT